MGFIDRKSSSKKLLAVSLYLGIMTTIGVIYKLSQDEHGYNFSTASCLVLSEALKFCLSAYLMDSIIRQSAEVLHRMPESSMANAALSLRERWTVYLATVSLERSFLLGSLVLALFYSINNNMLFTVFTQADPATINLMKSLSTIFTALMTALVHKDRRLDSQKWLIIVLQVVGTVGMQYDPCERHPVYPLKTYMTLMLMVFISSTATVWNESIIKGYDYPLHLQNMLLYAFGFLFNLVAYLIEEPLPLLDSEGVKYDRWFFSGYTTTTVVIVLLNSLMGIAVTGIYKYADAVAKNMVTSVAAVLLVVISYNFFDLKLTLNAVCAVVTVLTSSYMWLSAPSVLPSMTAEKPQ